MTSLAIILFSLILATFFTLFFALGFRNRGPWDSIGVFFLINFLGIWVAAIWLVPIGPLYYGVPWLPLFFVGLLISLLLSASIPVQHTRRREEKFLNPRPDESALAIFGMFFWLLLAFLIGLIILGYILR